MNVSIKNTSLAANEKGLTAYFGSLSTTVEGKKSESTSKFSTLDTVDISATAVEMSKTIEYTHPYAKYFPTSSNTPANNLAIGATNPSSEPFSGGKSSEDVAVDAREELDAQYKNFQKNNKVFNKNSFEGRDWYELFQKLDRRALYIVKSDKTGLFSKDERDMADSIMGQQQGLAMGLYSGPTSMEKTFVDPFGGNYAKQLEAHMEYLKNVSPDEKVSGEWMRDMMTSEILYITEKYKKKDKPEEEDPIIKLIKKLIEEERLNEKAAKKRD